MKKEIQKSERKKKEKEIRRKKKKEKNLGIRFTIVSTLFPEVEQGKCVICLESFP